MNRSSDILIVLGLLGLLSCAGPGPLTHAERDKLDPLLQSLLDDDSPSRIGIDVSYRPDGTAAYAVIVRSQKPDDIRALGITIASVFGDILTVRVSKEELITLARLTSVRAIQSSGMDSPQHP